MKKTAIAMLALVLCLLTGAAFAADTLDWTNCTACSETNPHMIATTADLDKIRTHIDTINKYGGEGNCLNGYFKLANDIVFTDADYEAGGQFYGDGTNFGFLPIGHNGETGNMVGNMFVGDFNGNNKTIKNFKTWTDPNRARWFNALFARTWDGAYIHDLTIADSYIRGSHTAVVVAQENYGTTRLENITLRNNTLVNDWLSDNSNKGNGMLAGMYKGSANNITIENCVYQNETNAVKSGMVIGKYLGGGTLQNINIVGGSYSCDTKSGLLFGEIGGDSTISKVSMHDTAIQFNVNTPSYIAYSLNSTAKLSDISIDVDVTGAKSTAAGMRLFNASSIGNTALSNVSLKAGFSGTANGQTLSGELDAFVEKNVIYINQQPTRDYRLIPAAQEICAYLNGGTFTAAAKFETNSLANPVKHLHTLQGWFSKDGTSDDWGSHVTTPTAGATYYARWALTNVYSDDQREKTLSFEMNYGDSLPEAQKLVFTKLNGDHGAFSGFTPAVNSLFAVSTNSATGELTVAPAIQANAGIHTEILWLKMDDDSDCRVTLTLKVNKADFTIKPDSTTINATYGDVITLAVNVKKADTSTVSLEADTAYFYDGSELLGSAEVIYDQTVPQQGSAELVYDTASQKLPVGTSTITVRYGGSINLNQSTTTITVNILPAPLPAPANLAWDAAEHGKATWGKVNNASAYAVQLYRNGAPVGNAVVTTALSYSFADAIALADGSYTFTVLALGSGTNGDSAAAAVTFPLEVRKLVSVPQTGDNTPIALWLALCVCAAGGVVALRRKVKA